jgi:CheY-like chemotaxis protein
MLDQKAILIVEDNAFLAVDLAMAVEDLGGCVVGPVARVDEAMSLLDVHQLAGAVLDSQLEDRDITPVVTSLVAQGIPLVIHTGTGIPSALALAHPDLPVLFKPLKPAIVLELLMGRMRDFAAAPSPAPAE